MMRWFLCKIGHHCWTTAAQQGIKATPEQLADPFWGFWDYAKMYCIDCGVEARESKESRAMHPKEKGL